MSGDISYTVVHAPGSCLFPNSSIDEKDAPTVQDLKNLLETGKDDQKVTAMKKILLIMLNGDPLPGLLMHVIRFVLPSKSKALKKLLLIYWEICPKKNSDGKPKQEMILVCNALRNDLQHPNEYIRGMTLRFLCKLKEPELLEPTVPAVRACLDHRHAYVRRNAILAIYAIHKNLDYLIPDAPELIMEHIMKESDQSCRRNAFIMLSNSNPVMASQYLMSVWPQLQNFEELMQLAVIEFIRKDFKSQTADKAKYIHAVISMLQSPSHSVKYEAATSLVSLTSHSSAMKAAASCYIELCVKEADNNVKLIVLERINEIKGANERILEDLIMDILRILASPDLAVRKKCLTLCMDVVSNRNVAEVMAFLKKEVLKTHDKEFEKNAEYRQILINAIHQCAIKFSDIPIDVVHVLMDFISENHGPSAVDVIAFVREVMEKFPGFRKDILKRLLPILGEITTSRVYRGALWIVGEYSDEPSMILEAFACIRDVIGDLPIAKEETVKEEGDEKKSQTPGAKVLADGTYATESAFVNRTSRVGRHFRHPFREFIIAGDFYLGSVMATALSKMVSRFSDTVKDTNAINEIKAEAMLIMTSMIRAGKSKTVQTPIDEDSLERIMLCLRFLSSLPGDADLKNAFLEDSRKAYSESVKLKQTTMVNQMNKRKDSGVQVDDPIAFRFLKGRKQGGLSGEYDADLIKATGMDDHQEKAVSKLDKVVQLTGFSDPVYAEAYVTVHQFDILLDIIIVNQTTNTLQNLSVDFSTLGDLKLVERPAAHTIGPRGFHTVKANFKVASTETGVIFGSITYDGPSAVDGVCILLNELHVDIMDYIHPADCSEQQFRTMWTEFEWENKVGVKTNITNLKEYLNHILKCTNMKCLTPEKALQGDCGFLAANLYAKSLFGEDALANISLEVQEEGIVGHVRIRSRTQGIALSLGDKVALTQKK